MGKPFFFFSVLVLVVLFLPIVLEGDLYYDVYKRKCIFSLRLYKWLPIIGGYFATYVGGLAMHVNEKHAVLLPYAEWKEGQKRISVLKLFRLRSLNVQIETDTDLLLPILWIHRAFGIAMQIAKQKRAIVRNSLWIRENKENLALSLQTIVWTNTARLLMAGMNIVKEKIKTIWKKKFVN